MPRPTKIIAVHINYRSRVEEGALTPAVPAYFLKPVSSIGTDGGEIVRPPGTELLTVEGEIAAIIGRRARRASPHGGLSHVGWFAAANDVGLADMRWVDHGANLFSKGQDGFTPIGPAVAAERVDPGHLTLRTRINGELVQEDSSANLIFDFGFLVADLSRFVTLEPGDIILTGTPAGRALVEPGDEVEVELDGAGTLRSRVVAGGVALGAFGAQPKVTAAARGFALGAGGDRPASLSEEAIAALRQLSTAALAAQLIRRGISNPFIEGLRSTRPDRRLVGYAHTLRYVPLREDVRDATDWSVNALRRAAESIGRGEVLVIEARRVADASSIGDISVARAEARGAAGVVTDGGLRDITAIAELAIPTYYQATHPAVPGRRHHPLETNVPIACGGALVMPGDVIVGDRDGLLVVPAALAEEVAADAIAQEERETWALERVRAGESVEGIYPLSEARRGEFEAWLAARLRGGR